MANIVYRFIEFDDDEFRKIIDHLGNRVRSIIQNDEEDDKEILLDYPVVYLHTWKEEEKMCVYVGETIDLARRTNEHSDNDNEKAWQDRWKRGSNHRSAYFSCKSMNKSLVLDLEDSLIAIFQKIEKQDKQKLHIVNGRDNQQLGYSNKNVRDEILKEIWNVVKGRFTILLGYEEAIKGVNLSEGKSRDNVLHFMSDDLQICEWAFSVKEEKEIEDFFNDKEEIFTHYPVVYMHIWQDESQKMHTYTGETNNIVERTKQHFRNNAVIRDFDRWLYEEDQDWHDSWREAVKKHKAYMFVFGHRDMNISVTRDIENYLIRYTILCELSSNGRRNEQRKYEGREEAYELFGKIVASLHDKFIAINIDRFKSLDEIKNEAAFLASPLLNLSDEQAKIKDEIMRKVKECSDDERHKLFLIEGEAGTGKTVLISSLYFDLVKAAKNIRLFINHAELFNVYTIQADAHALAEHSYNDELTSSITKAEEWINGIKKRYIEAVLRYFGEDEQKEIAKILRNPLGQEDTFKRLSEKIEKYMHKIPQENVIKLNLRNSYLWDNIKILVELAEKRGIDISNVRSETLLDFALIDESHLLAARGKNGGIKEAQLPIIVDNARMLVVMGDAGQYVDSGTKITYNAVDGYRMEKAYSEQLGNCAEIIPIGKLTLQHRMKCSMALKEWIRSIYTPDGKGEIHIADFPVVSDEGYYYVKRQDDSGNIFIYEKEKTTGETIYEIGLFFRCSSLKDKVEELKKENNPTGLIASYCWKYKDKEDDKEPIFYDEAGNPYKWHYTGDGSEETNIWTMEKSLMSNGEHCEEKYVKVRSFHDVQGFDLNYAGVIIGKSLRVYKGGMKKGKLMIDASLRPGISQNTPGASELVQNELNVLLSRGIKGLYIYAEDDGLRKELFNKVGYP